MNCTKNLFCPLVLLIWFLFGTSVYAQDDVLQQEISIAFEDLSLKESLAKLEQETGISTAYNERELKKSKITITFENELLAEVLDALLSSKNLSYKVIGNTITIYRKERSVVVAPKEIPKNYTISGYAMDAESRETLIGASIYVSQTEQGISSNEYGFYSLTLPPGTYEITFSYIGYESLVMEFVLDKNIKFSPALSAGNQLEEVIVTADDVSRRHSESRMSSNKLSMDKLESMPVLMGERDVLKLVQLMPGVQSGSEGSTGLYVRGGGPDQNLLLLDGVPIYNVNHLFGFLSTLNGNAIKSAEIIKGGFPARYGGRLSSVLDIRMKEGDMENFHGDLSVGLISGNINLEGPIKKGKTSFHFSGRRTWLDAITTPVQKAVVSSENGINAYKFYDLNAKLNHKFSDKSRIYLSSYLGKDRLSLRIDASSYKEDSNLTWGNKIISARWNYQFSPKLFSNTTLYSSNYDFEFRTAQTTISGGNDAFKSTYTSSSKIRDYGAKIDLNFLPNPDHHVRLGASAVMHRFTPTVNRDEFVKGAQTPQVNVKGDARVEAYEISSYIENDMSIGNSIQLNAGVHFALFNVETSNYTSLQPRAALSYKLNERSSVKLSYAHMTQFLHLLASPGLGLPTDLWVPSTDKIKPERSTQYALGYNRSLAKGIEVTVEGFYKTMSNLLEYKSGFGVFSSSASWEDKVLVGDGESYGVELLLEKRLGKTTGWIGYTLSKSDRTFPDLDRGEIFPYKYDRRHDISLALTHKKNERIDFGLIWVYGSGNTYTLGTSNYNAVRAGEENVFADGILSTFQPVNHVSKRNNQRAPAYHRLDLSINLHKQKRRGIRTWSFGFYNAYSRQNPFVLAVKERPFSGELFLEQTSLLPIVPFATYSLKF